jgi:glycosyltransferase involved in cell wall biosynthesis
MDQRPTEGTRKVIAELQKSLSEQHEVIAVDIRHPERRADIARFEPDVVHAIIGPASIASIVALRGWKLLAGFGPLVISALQFTMNWNPLCSILLRPSLILTQSETSSLKATRCGWKTAFLPNGVDTDRFIPVSKEEKTRLRTKHGLPVSSEIILHVGPVKNDRNCHWLCNATTDTSKVLIVSRPLDTGDPQLISRLSKTGAIVYTHYVEKIEEMYQLSDVYAFPATNPRSCIETPLSVLEACSCNLPIVTTRFGSLPRLLGNTTGVDYTNDEGHFLDSLRKRHERTGLIETRRAVEQLEWKILCGSLTNIYKEAIGEIGVTQYHEADGAA